MTSMLEKAARALENEAEERGFSVFSEDARSLALAVLKAIREPDEELFDTYWKVVEDHPDYTGRSEEYPLGTTVWQAMIDHITTEGKG